jgi:tetratricopeptide (TPR) repeat protein
MRRGAGGVLVLALVLAGCASHDDVRTRYAIERLLWQAQYYQRRVNIAFLSGSTGDMQHAIDAYRRVVAADPFLHDTHDGWDPAVAKDIRALLVSARVALANLYFASERYADAGTMYAQTLGLGSLNFKDMLDARMGAARVSFMEGNNRSLAEQCAGIFRDVETSPEFWSGKGDIDDVFLNIPVALVRLHQDDGDAAATDSSSTAATAFYRRVSSTWPGTRTDWQARMAVAQIHMVRGEWDTALADLNRILSDPAQKAGDVAGLELVAGEIEAFRLKDTTSGSARLSAVRSRYPQTFAAYAAAYDLAVLKETTDAAGAAEDFRALEKIAGVPDAVASRATLSRAHILERSGNWEEAYSLLRRIEQMYPFTTAAMEAPIVATRHYAALGNSEMLELALTHAQQYYNSLLDRGSAFTGNRAAAQAALVENFLASGRADEAARKLSDGEKTWDETSTAAGMLKAADLYRDVLHDNDQARATLEKVIARFPGSRFAQLAQERITALPSGS